VEDSKNKARFYLTLLPFIWGSTFAITKHTLAEVSPLVFAFARFALVVVLFLLIFPASRAALRVLFTARTREEKVFRTDSLMLGMMQGIGYALQFIGLITSTSTNSAFIAVTGALWGPIFARFVLKQHVPKQTILALGVAFLGLVLLTKPYNMETVVIGDLFNFLSAIAFGLQVAWIDRAAPHARALFPDRTKAGIAISSNLLFVAGIVTAVLIPFVEVPRFTLSAGSTLAILYNGLFATGLAIFLHNRYQNVVSASVAVLIFMLEPVLASIIGYLFMNERMDALGVTGALVIVGSVIVGQWKFPSKRKAEQLEVVPEAAV